MKGSGWIRAGEGEYGCSMIMLNSHHPFLPSSTRLSSPPPRHHALLSPSQLLPDMLTHHAHAQTGAHADTDIAGASVSRHTRTSRRSAALIPVSDVETNLELIPKSGRETRRENRKRMRNNSSRKQLRAAVCPCVLPFMCLITWQLEYHVYL